MAETRTIDRVLILLARTVEYPTPELLEHVRACQDALRAQRTRAARHIARFGDFVEHSPYGAMEELYTTTFDLKPVCYPYIGYQLFGDTYKRSEFLAQLNARFREHDLDVAGELPDHLGMVLRYLARTTDTDLVHEGVVPTLKQMVEQLDHNPYRNVLRAVLIVVQQL